MKTSTDKEKDVELYDFITILKKLKPIDYACYKYTHDLETIPSICNENETDANCPDHIPTLPDTIAHLKLLKALGKLKRQVMEENPDSDHIKIWKVYVTNAVRRFIIFISSLKKYLNSDVNNHVDENTIFYTSGNSQTTTLLDQLLPPLDVIMVWHSFLLSPRSFYDNCVRNDILSFGMFPLPLKKISESIENATFEYCPSKNLKDRYLEIIRSFTSDSEDLAYDNDNISMFEQSLSITCPCCEETILTDVPYTNEASTGFSDKKFSQKINYTKCKCKFNELISHEELRKRQLYSDMTNNKPLPGLFKFFSTVISDKYLRQGDTSKLKEYINSEFRELGLEGVRSRSLEDIIDYTSKNISYGDRMRTLLELYQNMNLIDLSVHGRLSIWEDLVDRVERQYKFTSKMNEINWLHSPHIEIGLTESTVRYCRFFELLSKYGDQFQLIPTLDIDLIWHTHQLSMHYYFSDCLNCEKGCVIDHDEKIELTKLDEYFDRTDSLYKERYGEEYSICHCWNHLRDTAYSPTKKSKGNKKFRIEKRRPKQSYSSLGITNISIHDTGCIPST